ncbi:Tim44/TimA family putative adaptor protein [Alphaproteobacteria bacterium]|nr:Tim44/TimA family putative adaptor protein [Alphaproteobacteria bacterium]
MQSGLPYLDILIFGVIAVFLILRLKNILGSKTGYDSSNIKKENKEKNFSNIIPLKSDKNNVNYDQKNKDLDKVKEIDETFNVDDFLSGSRTFFKMVLGSFTSGDLNTVKNFIKPSVLESFKNAIDDRNKDNETLIIDLKSIEKNEILSYKITKTVVKITVIFESKQIIALMDKNNELIDGNMDKEIVVKDEWIFERKINYKNPNWSLVQTKSL